MKHRAIIVLFCFSIILLAPCGATGATTFYVSATSGSDANSGLNWSDAKQTIQAAIDAASAGDTVLVTNGVYDTGSQVAPGHSASQTRVVVDKALRVQSMNGPANTFIAGQGPNGPTAIRCVWMTDEAVLDGFTLTNGHTTTSVPGLETSNERGGGVWATSASATLTNCILTGNSAFGYGGGANGGTLNNCTLTGNSVYIGGGGAAYSTLNNCTLSGNAAQSGGGSFDSILNNCTLSANTAFDAGNGSAGGGAYRGTLNNCTLYANTANDDNGGALGGGAAYSTLNNCTLYANAANFGGAAAEGGGAYQSTLNNCTLYGNVVQGNGGAYGYGWNGGGACRSTLNNSIVYGNLAGTDIYEVEYSSLSFCFTDNPHFVDATAGDFRLQSNSPCINAGDNTSAPTNVSPHDLGGQMRISGGTVDIGAYEYQFPLIFAFAGPHGSISPSGVVQVADGGTQLFTIAPDLYYEVKEILTNGNLAGTTTNFVWNNVTGLNTISVSFVQSTTTNGTPHIWLAGYGWTENFAWYDLQDTDGDGLKAWEEYIHGTVPTNRNTDDDQFDDGVEVAGGADPARDDSAAYAPLISNPEIFGLGTSSNVINQAVSNALAQVQANPGAYGLYNENNIQELRQGALVIKNSNNVFSIQFNIEESINLHSNDWQVLDRIAYGVNARTNKAFLRVRSDTP